MNATVPARILVISPNWIGDAVMAQPLLQMLKARPGKGAVPIDVMAPPSVAPVWRAMAEIDTVIEAPFQRGALQWRERRAVALQLRQRGYGEAYVLPNALKFALIPWLAGISTRIGYRGEMRYGLLNVMHHDSKSAPRPMVPFYAALAAPPCRQIAERSAWPRPRLQVSDAQRHDVRSRFNVNEAAPVVVFAPGAEFGTAKRWPPAHFAALAQHILLQHPAATILLLGSPKDRAVCDDIVAAAARLPGMGGPESATSIRNLAGETALGDAIALIAGAAAMVSNDSGLLHVASALNRPVVALYGPTDPQHAPPFSDVARSMYLGLACAPCRQRECPLGHHDCMRKLSPQMVWQPLQPMLD